MIAAQHRADDFSVPAHGFLDRRGTLLQHWPHAAARYVSSVASAPRHRNSRNAPAMQMSSAASPPMHESNLRGLTRLHQGKVRDIYAVDDAAHAHRHHRPPERVRRGAARPDPGQGPRAHQHLELLVRAHRPHRAEPPLGLPARARGAGRGRARDHRRPLHGRAAAEGAAASKPWCAATSSAPAGRTTRRPARSAASSSRRGCAWPTACRSRSSRPRPRPSAATTTRTSASRDRGRDRAPRSPPACATPPSRSTSSRPHTRSRAASSSPTPSSSSASTRPARSR